MSPRRWVIALGLLAVLAQLLVPPMRIEGHTGFQSLGDYTTVVLSRRVSSSLDQ